MTVRLKLTLSYAGFLVLAGVVLLGLWAILLRYFSHTPTVRDTRSGIGGALFPGRSHTQSAFGEVGLVVLGFLLVFGLVGGWFLAGRMLAPLARITDATRTAAKGSLSHRVWLEGRRDEFRELADAFDTMLERLEAQVAEQQRFAANASHELRTPLAITQTLLEVARNDPDREGDELDERLRAVNARAIELTEALLLLNRADQRSFDRESVDLSLIAEEAAETMLPLAEKRGVSIDTFGEISPAFGSPALLLQMTTNLAHNAIVHNLPGQGSVSLTTTVQPGGATLTVENTGATLSPELVATLVEPFQRGGDRARQDHAGVGLGLAIVQSIAHAHNATLTLAPRPGGGLRVTVQLPDPREPGSRFSAAPNTAARTPRRR